MPKNNIPEDPKRVIDMSMRLRAPFKSAEGKVLHYLKENPSIDVESTYLYMLRAFWYPYAAQATGTNKRNVRFLARASIYALMSHIEDICTEFEVSRPYTNYQDEGLINTDLNVNISSTNLLNAVKHEEENNLEDLESSSEEDLEEEFSDFTPTIDDFDNVT
jgi:hypothetical protein